MNKIAAPIMATMVLGAVGVGIIPMQVTQLKELAVGLIFSIKMIARA